MLATRPSYWTLNSSRTFRRESDRAPEARDSKGSRKIQTSCLPCDSTSQPRDFASRPTSSATKDRFAILSRDQQAVALFRGTSSARPALRYHVCRVHDLYLFLMTLESKGFHQVCPVKTYITVTSVFQQLMLKYFWCALKHEKKKNIERHQI